MKQSALLSIILGLCGTTAQAATLTGTMSHDGLGQSYYDYYPIPSGSFSVSSPDALSLTADDYPADPPGSLAWYFDDVRHRVRGSVSTGELVASTSSAIAGQTTSTIQWQQSVLNDSSLAQAYQMQFQLDNASLWVGGWTRDYVQRASAASFEATIAVNGQPVWQTSYHLGFNGGVHPVLTQSGVNLGAGELYQEGSNNSSDSEYPYKATSGGGFDLGGYSGVADLGTFAAGTSFDVSYTLTAQATFIDPLGCYGECGIVSAGISDPFALTGGGLNITAVTAVPEPSTYALTLLGLFAMGLAVQRRQASGR